MARQRAEVRAMSHTPGPWTTKETGYLNQMIDVEPSIGCVYGVGDKGQANARLIAAAPDLLAALEVLMGIVSDSNGVSGYHLNGDIAEWDEFDEINIAIAALAKAKGEG